MPDLLEDQAAGCGSHPSTPPEKPRHGDKAGPNLDPSAAPVLRPMNLLPDLVEYDETEGYRLEQDPTGLLNEGFRYRDPSTGTFLTRDPLGFMAGPNMYTYVRQNPWTHFDPEGLASEDDYKKDQQKATAWHNQATKDAGGDKPKQKQADDTYNKWMAADQKKIDSIESTARKWNEAAGKDVLKDLGLSWNKLDDKSKFYQSLANTSPKFFTWLAKISAAHLAAALTDPSRMAALLADAKANGIPPQEIATILTMEDRGWTMANGGTGLMGWKQLFSEAYHGFNMAEVSIGPAQLKGGARAAAGLSVDQAQSYQGAFIGAATWMSNKNPAQKPGSTEAQRAVVYNGGKSGSAASMMYGVEYQVVRSQIWK